jgi:DNA replication protein DnaC
MDRRKELLECFKELKLKAFQEQYEPVVMEGNRSIDEVLLQLCKLEIDRRYNARVRNRIKAASFPKIKTLAMLDFNKAPKLPKQTVETLATCQFIEHKRNVVLVGDSGGGKTHLAIALGIEACRKTFSVKFFTASELVNRLLSENKDGQIQKFLSKLKNYDLLIIDEMGFLSLPKKGAEVLFQVFSDRYETGSIIVTSNLSFSQWTEVFIDKTLTTALLDRLTHNATIIKYDWGSIRFNDTVQEQKKGGITPTKP